MSVSDQIDMSALQSYHSDHCFQNYSTPVEETMEALHDVVKAGKARYIGASSMEAWRFAR